MNISEVLRKAFFYDKWDIGVYKGSIEDFIKKDGVNFVSWLNKYNKYSFVADPFIAHSGKDLVIMAEYFNYFTCKGKIVSLTGKADFSNLKSTDEIVTAYHMSYPHIFEYNGGKYCIPETSAANKLMLYKYDIVTKKFKYESDLIENFAAIDSTVLHYQDKWWLFCTKGQGGANSDLYIWHSDNPLSGWQEYKNNPVKCDISSARPAGKFFMMDGKLFRPSQNCSKTYGGSIIINEIINLDETTFEERKEYEVFPAVNSSYPHGIHTLSIGNNIVVVDGKRLQFSILNPVFIVIQKIRVYLKKYYLQRFQFINC